MDFSFYNYVLEREGSIMGEGLGERIFTDQLPAYEEKEAFLRSIDRTDLADIHRYFFIKGFCFIIFRWEGRKRISDENIGKKSGSGCGQTARKWTGSIRIRQPIPMKKRK